jgi:hypothetical protein
MEHVLDDPVLDHHRQPPVDGGPGHREGGQSQRATHLPRGIGEEGVVELETAGRLLLVGGVLRGQAVDADDSRGPEVVDRVAHAA